ncbi:MAG: transposase zinc-binding domain-containing protein, partial [Alphaproteobacteria bacterium]
MIEVADIFRQFGDAYLTAFGSSMLPSHKRAIDDIIKCRTEAMGGHLYECDSCHQEIY